MRVLLVDDDDPTRLICRRVLTRVAGAELHITEASDGAAAIERLRSETFDGILCDHRMGAVTGIEVLTFARTSQPRTFRALMTGFADPSLEARARSEAQVHAFIEKPMTSGEFEAVLRRDFLHPLRQRRQQEA